MTHAAAYRLEDLPPELGARIVINPVTGCWEWQHDTGPDPFRYGQTQWEGRYQRTHRVVYGLLAGPIPEDRPILDHVYARGCRSNACCWPVHLEPVTKAENSRRGLCANLRKGIAKAVLNRVSAGTATAADKALAATAHIPPPPQPQRVAQDSALEPLLTAEEAAAILGVTADVMACLRRQHTGPGFFQVARGKFLYPKSTVLVWCGQVTT